MSIADKRRAFRALHQSGCFVIPNPWNAGSARYMQGLGFKALATTSSGYAHSIGYADGDVTRDMMLAHYREIAQATDIPLNADFEGGYAVDPEHVSANVKRAAATGIAGLSIEDSTATWLIHCSRSSSPWNGCARRERRSTKPGPASCSPAARRAS